MEHNYSSPAPAAPAVGGERQLFRHGNGLRARLGGWGEKEATSMLCPPSPGPPSLGLCTSSCLGRKRGGGGDDGVAFSMPALGGTGRGLQFFFFKYIYLFMYLIISFPPLFLFFANNPRL